MKSKVTFMIFALALLLAAPQTLLASSSYLKTFNKKYGTTGTKLDTCKVCHTTGASVNKYGAAVRNKMRSGLTLGVSLTKVQPLDSDKDTFTNIKEIKARSFPGKATSTPAKPAPPAGVAPDSAGSPDAASSIQTSATVVNTYAQNEYAHITFDQLGPDQYRYVDVKADEITIGQTAGYGADENVEAAGEQEASIPLGAWNTLKVDVYDTGTVKIYLDGSSEEFVSYDF